VKPRPDLPGGPYLVVGLARSGQAAALALPGVAAVITAKDLETLGLAWMPTISYDTQAVLAGDKVRFQGQEVAFVIATDEYSANDALQLIDVEYEPLPAIVNARKALDPDAPSSSSVFVCVVAIVDAIATPSAPPICCDVLIRPDAIPASALETPASAAIEIGTKQSAIPSAIGRPWPSDPVATSIHGISGSGAGCPCTGDPNRRNDSSCSSPIAPTAFNTEKISGDAWPFDRTKRSFARLFGSATS